MRHGEIKVEMCICNAYLLFCGRVCCVQSAPALSNSLLSLLQSSDQKGELATAAVRDYGAIHRIDENKDAYEFSSLFDKAFVSTHGTPLTLPSKGEMQECFTGRRKDLRTKFTKFCLSFVFCKLESKFIHEFLLIQTSTAIRVCLIVAASC